MKKIILLSTLFLTSYFLLLTSSSAQSPTSTPNTQELKEQLIENIASRVAELDLVEKRGIVGTVTDVANTQITISDKNDNTRFVDVDELTKFSNPDQEDSFGISDIAVGDTLSAIGLYNKESRRLLARFVNVVTIPRFIHGEIGEIDTTNRIFDVVSKTGEIVSIDVGNSTGILSYTKDEDLTNISFSEIDKNQRVIVVGFPEVDNENLIVADRIIIFPEIPSTLKPKETTSTSTESAEKAITR